MGQVTRLVTATMIVIAASWTAVGGRQQSAQAVPEELRERLQEATRLYNRAQLSEAIQVLTSMVESPPPTEPAALDLHLQALFLRGRCQLLRNNPELAREDFSRLVTLNPGYEPSASVPKAVLGFFAEVKAGMTARFVLRVSPHDALVELDGAPVRLVAEREGENAPAELDRAPDYSTASLLVVSGSHALRAMRRGHRQHEENIEIEAGASVERAIELERTSAVVTLISSPPGVEVLVDGRSRGRTVQGPPPQKWLDRVASEGLSRQDYSSEFVLEDMQPGASEFTFQRDCYGTRTERWRIDKLADYRFEPVVLEKAVGRVSVDKPAGAAVLLDGAPVGTAPVAFDACEGERIVEVRATGARDIQRLLIKPGVSVSITPVMKPVVALLSVVGVASGAPDRRLDIEKRLSAKQALFWVPPSDAVEGVVPRLLVPGWLSYGLDRETESAEAEKYSEAHLAAASAELTKIFEAQAVAEMRLKSSASREQNAFLLSILASGSTVPDVLEIDLGSGSSIAAAIDALNSMPVASRRSVGLTVSDVHGLKGAVVTAVRPGGAAARAGVVPGDVIETMDGRPVDDSRGVSAALESGDKTQIGVDYRDRQGTLKSARLPVEDEVCVISVDDRSLLFNVLVASLRSQVLADPRPGVRLNLVVALMRLKMWDEALAELGRVDLPTGAGVSAGTVHFLRGDCYAALGKEADARAAWQLAGASQALLTESGPAVADLVPRRLAALSERRDGPQAATEGNRY